MSPSPPPVAHTGKKSPTAAAAMGTAAMGMLKSTGDDDLNVDMDVGFPQNYSQ
jgi:hypothetical protein